MQRTFFAAAVVACLAWLSATGAHAQHERFASASSMFTSELRWAKGAAWHHPGTGPRLIPPLAFAASGGASAAKAVSSDPTALELARGRFRTQQVTGYLVAAAALTLALAGIPLLRERKLHTDDYGEDSCALNLFPYLSGAAFAAGLAVGITGSVRDRQLTRDHGAVGKRRTPWRAAVAGVSAGLTIATLGALMPLSLLCNS